jgi:Ca-activated chloride channel family protein
MHGLHDLSFVWPSMLWLLGFVPLLVLLYVLLARQRSRNAHLQQALGLASRQPGRWGRLARHLPPLLLLLGLSALIVAIARPQAVIMLPSRVDSIILAMDISGSMRATDIAPSRLAAAQSAARTFIDEQPSHVRIGVVAIAATAALAQSPTENRQEVIQAIDRLQLQPGTALGSGLVIALATLLPHSGLDVDQLLSGTTLAIPRDPKLQAEIDNFKPVPPGSDSAVAIVLLSDGQSNFGVDLLQAAKLTADRGVRVYTVGIGTTKGATLSVDGWSMRVRLDEDALRKVATMTGGEYFPAGNAGDLKKIYGQVSAKLAVGKGRMTEITSLVVAIGATVCMLAALLSVFRFNRVV